MREFLTDEDRKEAMHIRVIGPSAVALFVSDGIQRTRYIYLDPATYANLKDVVDRLWGAS